jgi:hypothetical protein
MQAATMKQRRRGARLGASAMAVAMLVAPTPSEALAPVLLVFVKQAAQQMAQSLIKDAILGSLRGMGCKGMAVANALEAMDLRGGGGMGGMKGMLGGGMPKLPPGLAMPSGAALPGMPALPSGMAGLPSGMALPGVTPGGLAAIGGLSGTAALPIGGMPADVAARMGSLMPGLGQLPAGLATDPAQAASMARMVEAMGRPLSPGETVAAIDELAELGFLPKAIQSELKECMVVLPAAIPALGMGMGMMKPMLPQLRQAREELRALPPEEQDEVAAAHVEQMESVPAEERASMLEHLDAGFFPPRVAQRVRAGLVGR